MSSKPYFLRIFDNLALTDCEQRFLDQRLGMAGDWRRGIGNSRQLFGQRKVLFADAGLAGEKGATGGVSRIIAKIDEPRHGRGEIAVAIHHGQQFAERPPNPPKAAATLIAEQQNGVRKGEMVRNQEGLRLH